jgi:hypothetical protein
MSKITVSELAVDSQIDIEATLPEFAKAWHDTVTSLFKMLELIQKHQNRPGFEKLCDALDDRSIIKRSVMSMLQRIIANPVLMAPKHRALLPPAYNTLWTLTAIKEDVLEAKIAKKELTPDLTLDAARKWKRELSTPKNRTHKKVTPLFATLKVESTSKLKINAAKIQKCLDQLQKMGILVVLNKRFK